MEKVFAKKLGFLPYKEYKEKQVLNFGKNRDQRMFVKNQVVSRSPLTLLKPGKKGGITLAQFVHSREYKLT